MLVGWELLPFDWRQAAPVEVTGDQVHVLFLHHGADREEELLPDSTFFGVVVVDVQRHVQRRCFWPLCGCRRKAAHETTPCNTHPDSLPFIWSSSQALVVPWLMSEKEGILVEQDRTTSIVCHMEAIRQEIVLGVYNFFL